MRTYDHKQAIRESRQVLATTFAETQTMMQLWFAMKTSIHTGMEEMAGVEVMALVKRLRAMGAING